MLRLYPVVRFVIVSGSKGKMLDVPALGALTTFLGGWGTCERALHADKEHGGSDWFTVRHGSEAHVRALRKELGRVIRTGAPVERVAELDGAVEVAWGGDDPGAARFDAVVIATAPDDAARLLGDAAPSWLGTMSTEALTVAVHSDERAVPPPEAREGAGRDANMIYVAGDARAGGDYSQVCMSVRWDDVHGDRVEPRPILTYHPELLDGGDRPLAGEVARMTMKHVHLPELATFARVDAGLRLAHHRRGARVFFAGAWTHHFSMSHPGAVHSGLDAALSLGVALDPKDFFLGRWYKDRPPSTARARAGDRDWKELLREAGGEWTCNSAANFPDGVYDAAGAGAGAEPPAFACAREEASAGRAARRDAKEYAGDFLSGLGGNAARPAR